MSRAYVRINLERLRRRLSEQMGRELSPVDAHQWLYDKGFLLDKEWECEAEDMDALREDEIIEKTITHTVDGVTFVSIVRY